MSKTLDEVRPLVARGEVLISLHGYEELAADKIVVQDVIDGLAAAVVVEDYPEYPKGPSVRVLEQDRAKQPIHVVWGIVAGQTTPAVVVTAYRPDPTKWDQLWLRRRP